MAGLIGKAGGDPNPFEDQIQQARQAWQQSMTRQLEVLRNELRTRDLERIAHHSGAELQGEVLRFAYWGAGIRIAFPALIPLQEEGGQPCSTFDAAILIYYLHTADGSPLADRWIGFRELPDGGFYHQAFQGYSGNRIAKQFGVNPAEFEAAAKSLNGWSLTALAPHAFRFSPLPKIHLAAALWPGDEDFPSKAAVLFDAAASHYMPTDGLALLGAGLAGRLIKATLP